MKKSLVLMAVLFSLVFAISGCSSQEPVNSEQVSKKIATEIESAGKGALIVFHDNVIAIIINDPKNNVVSYCAYGFNTPAHNLEKEFIAPKIKLVVGTNSPYRYGMLMQQFANGGRLRNDDLFR